MNTFTNRNEAVAELKRRCALSLDSAMVDGPGDGEFTVMPVKDAEEFGFYVTATRDGRLCEVTDKTN